MMGEMCDFENEHPQFMRVMGIDGYGYGKNGKTRKPNFHMTMTPAMKQMVKDLGGVVAVRRLIIDAHKKLSEVTP